MKTRIFKIAVAGLIILSLLSTMTAFAGRSKAKKVKKAKKMISATVNFQGTVQSKVDIKDPEDVTYYVTVNSKVHLLKSKTIDFSAYLGREVSVSGVRINSSRAKVAVVRVSTIETLDDDPILPPNPGDGPAPDEGIILP